MNQIEENFDNQSLIEVDQDLAEFKSIVNDIAKNESVLALREHVQHIASSRYSHLMEVSYYTYKICKKLNLDYISAARAAMLHDFYFYNWRNKGNRYNSFGYIRTRTIIFSIFNRKTK